MYLKILGHAVCIVPSKNQETTDFVTAKVTLSEPELKENFKKDIHKGIDECVIEVEAKSTKGILHILIITKRDDANMYCIWGIIREVSLHIKKYVYLDKK